MISLSQYKANLLRIFRLQIETDMYVDVSYKGKAYRISVENLKQDVKRTRRRKSLKDQIQAQKCPDCQKLLLNGVCMNSRCPGNAA
jgi:hypothetical protein